MKGVVLLICLLLVVGCGGPTGELETVRLTVQKVGNGVVTSSPEGINCGQTCAADFTKGIPVTLSPVPDEGSTFAKWTGACPGQGACALSMTDNFTTTAHFELQAAIVFVLPPRLPNGQKGNPFNFKVPKPEGGQEPYSYRTEGFPPMGLVLSPDGTLSGTPTNSGETTFTICAVDLSGKSVCEETTIEIEEDSLSGEWEGDYKIDVDVSSYCPNMDTLVQKGPLEADITEKDGVISGKLKVSGIKSLGFGITGCKEVAESPFLGTLDGQTKDDDVRLDVDFGDPDLIINEATFTGKLGDNEIKGPVRTSVGTGSFSLKKT